MSEGARLNVCWIAGPIGKYGISGQFCDLSRGSSDLDLQTRKINRSFSGGPAVQRGQPPIGGSVPLADTPALRAHPSNV
jgi:hypothetical protein